MLIERKNMEIEPRPNMRGGPGECAVTFLAGRKLDQKHAKLFSEITIPPGAGIGEHEHSGETEYYLILEGTGQVNDNGTIVQVKPGDVVVTTGGAKHSIHTTGDITLRMVAVIITDD